MSEEFYIKTLENIKEYMQNSIDTGYHKFIYNDLGWDVKCVDVISAIDMLIDKNNELLDLYQKEKQKNEKLEDKIKRKIKIRKEEKAECKDSIEANLILREIYVLQELLQ